MKRVENPRDLLSEKETETMKLLHKIVGRTSGDERRKTPDRSRP
jgi:hypothetical protein